MPHPVPTPVTEQVPISQFDCVRKGDPKTNLELDAQRFETVAITKTDAKQLWIASAIPVRQVFITGPQFAFLESPAFFDVVRSVMNGDPRFNKVQFGDFWFLDASQTGLDGPFVRGGPIVEADIGDTNHSQDQAHNGGHAASAWWFGPANGNNLATEAYQLMAATVSEVVCPNAFAPVPYDFWTCTIRALTGNAVGPTVGNGMEFPWSLSTDFVKGTSGVLHPGQFIPIPCPIDMQPQAPPAPPSKEEPYDIQSWTGWGVCRFMVFNPPLV